MNTLLHFLLCQSCRSLRKVSLDGPHILFQGLIKRVLTRLSDYDDVIKGPPFQPCLGPPNPKFTTVCVCLPIFVNLRVADDFFRP